MRKIKIFFRLILCDISSFIFYWKLRREFSNMAEAKVFYAKWRITQEYMGETFSLRSMAYHCGRVLQGWHYDHDGGTGGTSYADVPEAIEIYYSFWELP